MTDLNTSYSIPVNAMVTTPIHHERELLEFARRLRKSGKPFTMIIRWDGEKYCLSETSPPTIVREK